MPSDMLLQLNELQGNFSFVGPTVFTYAGGDPLLVMRGDPNRWGFVLGQLAAPAPLIMPIAMPSAVQGYVVPSTGIVAYWFRELGALINQPWFFGSTGLGSQLVVTEVILG